ncbi:hypothetical protein [Niallia sp. MER TA 168]|nr:hypothetical protein [Niallia sp. MER TA 168]MCM3364032.1 transposase [Niallia sp. MER TA 168]
MEENHNKIKLIKRRGFGYRISICLCDYV